MTRQEKIHEVANTIDSNVGKEIDEDYNCADVYDFTIGFECGAKWADEHPKEGLVKIDNVRKWLETNFYNSKYWDVYGEYVYINDLVNDLCKAMEK